MAERFVDVVIRAKELMASGLSAALGKVRTFQQQVNEFGKGADPTGLLSGGLKIGMAVAAARGAMTSLNAITHAIRGEWGAVGDALEQMPLGVGAIARDARALWDNVSGAAAAAKMLEDAVRGTERVQAERKARQAGGRSMADDLQREMALLSQSSDLDRKLEQLAQERDERLAKAGGSRLGEEGIAKLKEKILEVSHRKMADATREFAERRQKDEAAAVKEVADAEKRSAEERRREIEKTAGLESEVRQARLRESGKLLDAEQERVREHYRQLRATTTAEQRAQFDELERIELAATGRKPSANSADRQTEAIILSNRFQGLAQQRKDTESILQRGFEAVVGAVGEVVDVIRNAPRGATAGGYQL